MGKAIKSPESNQQWKPSGWRARRGKWLLGILALAVAIGIVAYVLNARPSQSNNNPSSADVFNLMAYTYKGIQAGTGLTFQKPDQFTLSSSASSSLNRTFIWTNTGQNAGSIYVSSIPLITGRRQAELDSVQGLSQNADSQSYQAAVQQVVLRARGWMGGINSQYVTRLDAASVFRPTAYDSSAWQFPLSTATLKKPNLTTMKGQFIFIVGKNAIYYFGVAASSQKWQQDSATWQQVLNNIKIDQ